MTLTSAIYAFTLVFLRCSHHAASKKPLETANYDAAVLARYLLSLNPALASERPASRAHGRQGNAMMQFGLFGNTEESKRRRDDLVLRTAPAGSRKLAFRKPPQTVQNPGAALGIQFKQNPIGNIFVDKILAGSEADKYKSQGKLSEGDEVVMVSATFGDEMWSCRGVGVNRLYSSLKVRSGGQVAFVFESKGKNDKRQADAAKAAELQAKRMSRLQDEIARETGSGGKLSDVFKNPFR